MGTAGQAWVRQVAVRSVLGMMGTSLSGPDRNRGMGRETEDPSGASARYMAQRIFKHEAGVKSFF